MEASQMRRQGGTTGQRISLAVTPQKKKCSTCGKEFKDVSEMEIFFGMDVFLTMMIPTMV